MPFPNLVKLRKKEEREIQKILQPKDNHSEVKYGYFDTETYQVVDIKANQRLDARVYGCGWFNGLVYKYSFKKDAIKDLIEDLRKQKGEIVLGAHNAAYDLPFFIREVVEGNHGFKFLCKFTSDSGHNIISAKFWTEVLKIHIGCTGFGERNLSLRAWSEALGSRDVKKLTLDDYEKFNMNDDLSFLNSKLEKTRFDYTLESEYLRNDVMLLPAVISKIEEKKAVFSKLSNIDLVSRHIKQRRYIVSSPAAAKECASAVLRQECKDTIVITKGTTNEFDSRYRPILDCYPSIVMGDKAEEENMHKIMNGLLYDQIERGYRGGFTSGSPELYKASGKIRVLDVNSMYPSIMAEGIPYGCPTRKQPRAPHVTGYSVTCSYCNGVEPYNVFDNEYLGKTFDYFDGETTFMILKETYDLATRMCDHDMTIIEVGYQPLCFKLSEFILNQYNERIELKKKLKTFKKGTREYSQAYQDQDGIKLFLNSLYGKLAERHHPTYEEISAEVPKLVEKQNEDIGKPCILGGSYVTAKARVKLMSSIADEIDNGNRFLYCDTDSIFLEEKVPIKLELDPEKLGAGKDEGIYDEFRYMGKHKKYILGRQDGKERIVKLACAGLPLKEEIKKMSIDMVETIFDPNNNVRFLDCKNCRVRQGDFGIPILMKTHYDFNSGSVDSDGKVKSNKVTHICKAPYTALEPYVD